MRALITILAVLLANWAWAGPGDPVAGLDDTAEEIRAGALDVGKINSLGFPGRFHTIHAKTLGMGCLACHSQAAYAADRLFLRQAEFPQRGHPGAVDRATCIACHKPGGAATAWYRLADGGQKGATR